MDDGIINKTDFDISERDRQWMDALLRWVEDEGVKLRLGKRPIDWPDDCVDQVMGWIYDIDTR